MESDQNAVKVAPSILGLGHQWQAIGRIRHLCGENWCWRRFNRNCIKVGIVCSVFPTDVSRHPPHFSTPPLDNAAYWLWSIDL